MAKGVGLHAQRALACAVLLVALACPALAQAQVGGANGWIEARTFNHAGYGDYRVELVAADGTDAAPSVPFAFLTSPSIERTIYGGEGTVALNRPVLPNVLNSQVAWIGAQLGTTADLAAAFAAEQTFPGVPAEDRLCTVRARVLAARLDGTLVWQRYWSRYHRGTANLCGETDNTHDLKVDYVLTSASGAVLSAFPRVVLQRNSVPEGGGRFFATADPDVLVEAVQENGAFSAYRHVLSTGERTLVRAGIAIAFWPGDVSPDGRLLVNTSGPDLQVLDLATGTTTTVLTAAAAAAMAPATGLATALEDPQFSPDGTLLAFRRDATSEAGGFDTLMTVGVDGSSPRVVRALPVGRAMDAPSWSVIAGTPVSGRVMARSCGRTTCSRKGLDGVTVTASRAGVSPVVATTGDDGAYRLSLTRGTWTLTPTLRDAEFDPKTRDVAVDAAEVKDVDFDTCGPSPEDAETEVDPVGVRRLAELPRCKPDFVVDAVEVTQAVQARLWYTKTKIKVPGIGTVPGGTYRTTAPSPHNRATSLVTGKPTVVRVYVRASEGHAGATAPPVRAVAYAGGAAVELARIAGPSTLTDEEEIGPRRAEPKGAYLFALPEALTSSARLTVMAEVTPKQDTECAQKACLANNRWALANVPFVATRPFVTKLFGTVSEARVGGSLAPLTNGPIATANALRRSNAAAYLPLRPGDLVVLTSKLSLNIVAPTAWAKGASGLPRDGVFSECAVSEPCMDKATPAILSDFRDAHPVGTPHALLPYPDDVPLGFRGYSDPAAQVSVGRPALGTLTHELLHQDGLLHSGTSAACRQDSAGGEAWPDGFGTIVGWGVRPDAGWNPIGPGAAYDVMSYCGVYSQIWLSNLQWNRLVGAWRTGGNARAAADVGPDLGPALAAGAGLRVNAVLSPSGGEPYLRTSAVRAVPTPSNPAGTVTVTAYDAAGTAIASIRAVDRTPEGAASVDVVLPVVEAARVELTRDGSAPSVAVQSATAPTVALTSLARGARVTPRTQLAVTWTMADADGDALRARVDYSADDGRTWSPVTAVGAATSLRLPAGALTAAAKGRLRVVVSDGMRESVATSGRLRVTGRPPAVTLRTKGTLRVARNTALRLSGFALDERDALLPRASLRWLEGRKLLGRGEAVSVRYARKGTHTIALVATDRTGLKTTRTLRVVVR